MYDRQVGEQPLNFGVSGLLWNSSLVMYDKETQSLWSHILGEAMDGELEGSVLDTLPSVMMSWDAWKTQHPETTVLHMTPTAGEYTKRYHQGRLGAFGLGIVLEGEERLYPFQTLAQDRVINDEMGAESIVVTFDMESTAGRMFRRTLGERTLTFEPEGEMTMKDVETGSTWNIVTGDAEVGELEGEELEPLPAVVSFSHVWAMFHPETTVYGAEVISAETL